MENSNTYYATFNKSVTLIKTENGRGNVTTFRTKRAFWAFVPSISSLEMKVSMNVKNVIKKLKAAGFSVVVDEDFGFEWEVMVLATK